MASMRSVGPAIVLLAVAAGGPAFAQQPDPQSRRTVLERFEERFSSEIFPILSRQVNGCGACHHSEAPQSFRLLDTPGATYSLLLENGLLSEADPMAILGRLTTEDHELKMPQSGELDPGEVATIHQFTTELSRDLAATGTGGVDAHDERFPDGLLLGYDGPDGEDGVYRRQSYYQLRHSFATLFGRDWLASSGSDPFDRKANLFGGADFRGSYEISRTISTSYLTTLQEVAREVARRYVSAPDQVLFEGFDPDVWVSGSRRRATRNVRTLYRRILNAEPTPTEAARALALVERVQDIQQDERIVSFSLEVTDPAGRAHSKTVDARVRAGATAVRRFQFDQAKPQEDESRWHPVGNAPFRFEAGNPAHFVRVVAHPGNHVTAFDAIRLAKVVDGTETADAIVLDNLDPECTFTGTWTPVEKDGERSRAGPAKKKYEQDLHVVGSNHLESRTLDDTLSFATVTPQLTVGGDYNVYLAWPSIPGLAGNVLVEVHSAAGPPSTYRPVPPPFPSPGFATVHLDQTESTLDASGETQWELIQEAVYLEGPTDFVEISNRGVDSTRFVIAADAVKFSPMSGGPEIIVDNGSVHGFERSEGWASDELVRNSPGRGKAFDGDLLHYPPSKNGKPIEDSEPDPEQRVWARFRPVRDGAYVPGWYGVHLWTPGGHTHANWVPVDVHGSAFAPVAVIQPVPEIVRGETVFLDGTASHHSLGEELAYRWSHNAHDLGLQVQDADTPLPRIRVPSLASPRPGWAGLIEALLQRPEFIVPSDSPSARPETVLARVALDLVGRMPTQGELRAFRKSRNLEAMVDGYLEGDSFRDFFFHRARAALRSRGTDESDEPARLWTFLATTDRSYRELFTADYSVNPDWEKVSRRPEHGHTGILTMKGYLVGRPGLPSFTYPAQVLTLALGLQFEVSDAVEQAREDVVSTTDPASMCYSCHKLLTPLAFQRERWDVHGHYRTVDEEHQPIDDSDRGVVSDYPFAGVGLGAFSSQVVRKERFVRSFVNLHHDLLFHRRLRVHRDHRDEYKTLYDFAVENDLRIRPLLKRMVLMRYGTG